jgi:hypothetical protein
LRIDVPETFFQCEEITVMKEVFAGLVTPDVNGLFGLSQKEQLLRRCKFLGKFFLEFFS